MGKKHNLDTVEIGTLDSLGATHILSLAAVTHDVLANPKLAQASQEFNKVTRVNKSVEASDSVHISTPCPDNASGLGSLTW